MQEQCTYDSTTCLWFNENPLSFPELSSIFLPNTIYKFSHLKSFYSKSFHWCLTFKCFLSISNTLHFRKLSYFSCLYLQVLSFECLFLLKVILQISCIKRFLHISNLLHSRASFTLTVFIIRSHLLVFYAMLHVFTINFYSCNLVSRTYVLITSLDL